MIFSLKTTFLQDKEILQEIGEKISSIYFVEYGIIEVQIYLENQVFIVDRLYRGSVINADLFHTNENAHVQLISMKKSVIRSIDYSIFKEMC